MKERHLYNNSELNPPNNYEAIGYEIVYDSSGNANTTSTIDLEIGAGEPNDAYSLAKAWKENDITQGLPYKVIVSNEMGKEFTIFEGFINLWSAKVNEANKLIEAQAQETRGLSWLAENGDGVNFEFLYSQGFITDDDFVDVPYVINRVGRNSETFLTLLSGFVITMELRKLIIYELPAISSRVAGVTTTIPAIVELIGFIVYLTLLFLSLIAIVLELFDLIINPTKYHKGMKVLNHLNAICNYFGFTLSSSILQSDVWRKAVILPEKYTIYQSPARRFLGRIKTTEGTENGYYRGTVGEFLEAIRTMFYAKINIIDNVLYIEKDDFRIGTPAFKIPDLGGEYQTYTYNIDDFYSSFILEFVNDSDDRNTILNFKGTSVQVNTKPSAIFDQRNNLARRLDRVTIPFALGKRKAKLNFVEKVANTFLKVVQEIVNGIIALLNGLIIAINSLRSALKSIVKALRFIGLNVNYNPQPIPPIPKVQFNIIENRKNYLVMENDFVYTPKILLLNDDGKLAPENDTHLNAKYLYENFHYLRNFVDGNNQWLTYDLPPIQIGYEEMAALRLTNYAENAQGQEVEILNMKLSPALQVLEGQYRVRQTYANNLSVEIIEPE